MDDPDDLPQKRLLQRRHFIQAAASGTVITALGEGGWVLAESHVNQAMAAATRADGRPRLPPGQRVVSALKPMGGQAGDPSPGSFRLKVHGEVERPLDLDFAALRALRHAEHNLDVHCVTGWSAFDVKFRGVSLQELAQAAGVKTTARYVIFEAAHGYTANVPLAEALRPDVLVVWEMNGQRLSRDHGAPVRAINPHLYFLEESQMAHRLALYATTKKAIGRHEATTTTLTLGKKSGTHDREQLCVISFNFRPLLRAVHRDAGYLAVGLTFVYASSGLAVNHIGEWDPNFQQVEASSSFVPLGQMAVPGTAAANEEVARKVLHALGRSEQPEAIYAPSATELDITFDDGDLHVDLEAGQATWKGQRERFLLRTANFLHLNRGKKAWTYIADGYAVLLLVLAMSGMFMLRGKQGLLGRGGALVLAGASVPILYVVLSSR